MEETSASKETSEPNEKKKKPLSRRIVVTVIFLTSLSMCIFETNEIIVLYLSKPIETQIKMTVNDAMEFPAVTICNLNPVRRSRLEFLSTSQLGDQIKSLTVIYKNESHD